MAALLTVSTAVGIAEGVDAGRIAGASPLGQAVMYGQATVPLVAALVARRVAGRSGAPGLGFRRPTLRSLARAWLYGTATVLGGAALVWATGLGGFAAGEVGPGVLSGGPRSRDGVHRGWTARYGHRDFP